MAYKPSFFDKCNRLQFTVTNFPASGILYCWLSDGVEVLPPLTVAAFGGIGTILPPGPASSDPAF